MWTVPELFIFSIKEGLEGDSWLRRKRRERKLSGSQRVLDAKGCCPPTAMCREDKCGWEERGGRGEQEDQVRGDSRGDRNIDI